MTKPINFTEKEIELLSKSSYVKFVRQNSLLFTYEFRCILYDEWVKQPSTTQIRKVLQSYGFDCSMLGADFIYSINFAQFKKIVATRSLNLV